MCPSVLNDKMYKYKYFPPWCILERIQFFIKTTKIIAKMTNHRSVCPNTYSNYGIKKNNKQTKCRIFFYYFFQLKNNQIELFTSHYSERTSGLLTESMKIGMLKALKVLYCFLPLKGSFKIRSIAPDKALFSTKSTDNFLISPWTSWKHAYIILTPLNPLLYSKTGVHRGINYFSYFCSKTQIMGTHQGSSNKYPQSMFWVEIWKISVFLSENFQFLEVKFSIYLNRQVFS